MRDYSFTSLVLILFLVTACGLINAQQPSATTLPEADEPLRTLPDKVLNTRLKSVRGPDFRLSKYSGKVLVITLWATWCGPCQFETPALVKLQRQFRSREIQVVELSTENPLSSTNEVRKWVRRFKVNYRVGWAPADLARTLMNGRDAIPQTYIVSRTGRIVRRFIGWNVLDTVPRLKLAIKEAIDDKPKLSDEH